MATPSTATEPRALPPLTRRERDLLIRAHGEIEERIAAFPNQRPPIARERRWHIRNLSELVLKAYFCRLPRAVLSRCPFCLAELSSRFDPWGFEGFWWQQIDTGRLPEPHCDHFVLLQGAVNLNGVTPQGGRCPVRFGPEAPFVIPRILTVPGMVAVISCVNLANGFRAYPISYFSSGPVPIASKPAAWTRATPAEMRAGSGPRELWDFDLLAWAERGKIKWIEPGDPELALSRAPVSQFPYAGLPGAHGLGVIECETLRTLPCIPEE